ncbi:NlpC/P60 family protein [Paenibacillus sp. TRM 82003]|uniref:NlpC/P60 family protein n=1 Tax=Kineococcus sp. TRM81007 TaxID=2925831 RepID=UPI001F55EDB3|nr:NlpC/P60 family protein [Kineococcus sp. TRM81007]MCI2239626.1 NlpC/P60 family protein [Kineococcus sp. TRM81007]MCI3926092.1 NlpC/P60 family protein [Paenibacillus sp. TRM 82003]
MRIVTRRWTTRTALAVAGALSVSLLGTVAPASTGLSTPAHAATCAPSGDIGARWRAMGAERSVAGACVSAEFGVARGGRAQVFQGATFYWSARTGAHPVFGAIREEWARTGWENGPLGFPTSAEFTVRDGGRVQRFEGGLVLWTPALGAHEVRGAFGGLFAAQGWENGYLGFPVTGEVALATDGGRMQTFQGGTAYWVEGIGAKVVRGAIQGAWGRSGWESGALGYPVTDEHDVPGGKRSDFQRGYVTWDAGTGTTEVTITDDTGPWLRPTSWHPAVPSCRPIDTGYNGSRVKLVQRRLGLPGTEVEWNKGTTTTAIHDFQRSARLPVTGVVDRTTWERLGIAEDFCMDGWQHPIEVAPNAVAAQRVGKMIEVAHRYLGTEYVWGGAGPVGYGTDCSGLVLQSMLAAGLSPRPVTVDKHPLADYRTSAELYAHGGLRHLPLAQVQRGDFVFYTSDSTGRIVHVAIALGGGKMIESPNQRGVVRVVDITRKRGAETLAPTVVRPFN